MGHEPHRHCLRLGVPGSDGAVIRGYSEWGERGVEKGIHQGGNLKAITTAEKLILRGFGNEYIADITGPSIDEIEAIRKRLN